MSLFHFHDTAEHGHGHGTLVESLDPRVKLVCAVALAVWVGFVPNGNEGVLAFLAVGLVVVAALAGIPPATLLVRSAGALPFVLIPGVLRLMVGTFSLHEVLGMAARGYTSAMVATLLVSVTPFAALLAAASALRVPDLLVQTTALIYRYLLVLRERAAAMVASAQARGYGPQSPRRFAIAGNMLGSLLVRSLDRSERVHRSMLARGYTGKMPTTRTLSMRWVDWGVGALVLGTVAASLLWMSR